MVGGQALDLAAEKLEAEPLPSAAAVRALHAMKTGALIRFACRAGPLLANASARDLALLTTYGEALGFAFQVADDLLDATGDAATVGKAVAKDAVVGKATAVSLAGVSEARRLLATTQAEARAAIAPFGDGAAILVAAVDFVAKIAGTNPCGTGWRTRFNALLTNPTLKIAPTFRADFSVCVGSLCDVRQNPVSTPGE